MKGLEGKGISSVSYVSAGDRSEGPGHHSRGVSEGARPPQSS